MIFQIKQIGTIHSPYKTKQKCPIQGSIKPQGIGFVKILPEYEAALETIETFSHIILFYIFDEAGDIILSRPTFLDDAPHCVFCLTTSLQTQLSWHVYCKAGAKGE